MTSLLNYVRNWFGSVVQPSDFSYILPLLMVNSTVAFPNNKCCPGVGHAGGVDAAWDEFSVFLHLFLHPQVFQKTTNLLQLWPEIPVISTYNPIYNVYNPTYNQL